LKKCDVLIVSAPGGHLSVAKEIFSDCNFSLRYIITTKNKTKNNDLADYIIESNRDFNVIFQLIVAIQKIILYKPKIVVSTGAGVAVPFFVVAKFFCVKTIFIESASRVDSLSLAGRLVYNMSNYFFVRTKYLSEKYKKAIYVQ